MDVVGKNSEFAFDKFAWLISTAVVNNVRKRLPKVQLEVTSKYLVEAAELKIIILKIAVNQCFQYVTFNTVGICIRL